MIAYPASRLLPLAVRAVIEQVAARATGRSLRVTPWIPLQMVEDADLEIGYPESHRMTVDLIASLVASFNPRVYRPPVVLQMPFGEGVGNPHENAEEQPPVAWLTGVDFDGITIWGQFTEIIFEDGIGGMERAVSDGYLGRSIAWWPRKAGLDAPLLRHVLMLSSWPEGQAILGLPPLSQYFKSAFGAEAGTRAEQESFTTSRALFPSGRSEDPMESSEIIAKITELLGAAKQEIKESTSEVVAEVKTEVTEARAAVPGQIAAAVDPLKVQIEAVRTETATEIATLKTDLAAARAESTRQVTTAREAGYRSTLESLVAEGKFAAGEVPSEIEGLMARSEEKAAERITLLKARQPMLGAATRAALKITGPEGSDPLIVPIPEGAGPAFEIAARATAALPADKKDDAQAYAQAVRSIAPGGPPAWTN